MKKKICLLGSTGSIGKSTLEIISKNKKDFEVVLPILPVDPKIQIFFFIRLKNFLK